MSNSVRKRLTAFVMCVIMVITSCFIVPLQANAAYTEQTITVNSNYQTVDTFYGVPAKYILGYSDTGDYCCAAYVSNFYQKLYGVTVYNINMIDDKPSVYCSGKKTELKTVTAPKPGDIMQTKEYTHVAIVKECDGNNVTLIEQNYKWTSSGKVYTIINRKIPKKDYYFYRLYVNGVEQTPEKSSVGSGAKVNISQTSLNLKKGGSATITAKMSTGNEKILWKSSNTSTAKVNSGKVTAMSAGKAEIMAYTATGKKAICNVTSKDSIANAKVASVKSVSYTGSPQAPKITLTYNGKTLVNGVDYEVKAAKEPIGPAKATVSGKGIFSGSMTVNYSVKPSKITNVNNPARSSSVIRLSWNKVSGADGYIVSVYNSSTKKWQHIYKGKALNLRNSKLKSSTEYKYKLNAYKTVGKTYYYSPDVFFKAYTTPKQTKISSAKSKNKAVTIKFASQSKISGREIYVSSSKTKGFKKLGDTSASTYTAKNLKKNSVKYFKARAYKKVNGKRIYGAFSSIVKVTVK